MHEMPRNAPRLERNSTARIWQQSAAIASCIKPMYRSRYKDLQFALADYVLIMKQNLSHISR